MNELSQAAMVNKASQLVPPGDSGEVLSRLEDITAHLAWIRWELALLVLLVIFFVAVLVVLGRKGLREGAQDFSKTAQQLLNQESYADVVRLGRNHVKAYPGDANAHWVLAQAEMRVGNYTDALVHARKTQELQPDWEEKFTGQMIRYLEEQQVDMSKKPDLRVVPPGPAQPDTRTPPRDVPPE